MEYYILLSDDRIPKPVALSAYSKDMAQSDEDIVIQESFGKNTKAVDYIQKRFLFTTRHIVSDMVREVLGFYDDTIKDRAVFVSDTVNHRQYVYWEVAPATLSGIYEEGAKDYRSIRLIKDKLQDKELFLMPFQKQEYLVLRFDVMESILRRFPLGIAFQPLAWA